MDEISANTPTRVSELRDGTIRTYDLQPSLCLDDYEPGPIGGGAPAENAAITRGILSGTDRGPNRAVVLINAGAAIYLYGLADSVRDGVRLAAESIDSGRAFKKLEALIRASQNG
jgi:anthranilate phosphoribosyltransferase